MSIMSPIPVLQGRDGTVLSAEQEGLVLERSGEELTIPAEAIARVHAKARSVTVELRAPLGATPSVHRIEDVSEAAATAFADAVNALLPEPTEKTDGGARGRPAHLRQDPAPEGSCVGSSGSCSAASQWLSPCA
ncbi:hypothetical protein [Streptomyces cupreus]|uniref:Uncharacterized protein n=1 Tax=Streptomyces cupreus TaxID=2759956 RepID=A0A7X1JC59_9ACTN|nr:hypothetical protein [Streptomyces cupreus]MBC2908069.1 hypothetical protein [Streptomyces cupreus]